jgi:hypothetical protein
MLDADLARLYGVETFNLNKAVRRNRERFPDDFMFQLTPEEYLSLRFQIGMLKRGQHKKYLPYVFTQEGISMLSSVLRSPRAVKVNITIMRAFVRVGKFLTDHRDIQKKIEELEHRLTRHDGRFKKHAREIKAIFEAIQAMLDEREPLDQNVLKPVGIHQVKHITDGNP